jgi:large subunit ribosomal protein L29
MSKITKELKELSLEELKVREKESRKELLKLNAQVSTGTGTSSPGKLKQLKKNVARIKTIIKQKGVKDK